MLALPYTRAQEAGVSGTNAKAWNGVTRYRVTEGQRTPNPGRHLTSCHVNWRLTKDTNAPEGFPEQVLDWLEGKAFSKCTDFSGRSLRSRRIFSVDDFGRRREK